MEIFNCFLLLGLALSLFLLKTQNRYGLMVTMSVVACLALLKPSLAFVFPAIVALAVATHNLRQALPIMVGGAIAPVLLAVVPAIYFESL
ncbi:MAG: hypothetical protein HOI95_25755 [Chromatiales bacterium]|nr:hypothetical protein [Chromatiales bacterium]